jgi:hypothetical protein
MLLANKLTQRQDGKILTNPAEPEKQGVLAAPDISVSIFISGSAVSSGVEEQSLPNVTRPELH